MTHNFMVRDIIPPVKVKKYAKKPDSAGPVPFISCQTTNNGIACMCNIEPEVENCITVSTNGNCFDCFYHDYAIVPSTDVEVLYRKGITDVRERALYLCAVLRPFAKLYSYSNKPKNGKVFDTIISLPVIESSDPHHIYTPADIDWAYMEEHIRRIEEEHIRRIEAYLKVADFESTILTPEEQEVLRKFRMGGVIFRKYRISDLFGKPERGTRLTKSKRIVGDIPLVTAGEQNQGIAECISNKEQKTYKDMLTIDMFGNCFYRDYKYKADDNILSFSCNMSREISLYVTSAINKSISKIYNYGNQFRLNSYMKTEICLPCLPSGAPDYTLMEIYIRTLEKLTVSRLSNMQKKEEKVIKKVIN